MIPGVELQSLSEQNHSFVVETILGKAGTQSWGGEKVGGFRWGYPREGGVRREGERESHLPAPGSAVRQLPAVPEMPRDGEQSQAGLRPQPPQILLLCSNNEYGSQHHPTYVILMTVP